MKQEYYDKTKRRAVQYILPLELINEVKKAALDREIQSGRSTGQSEIVEEALRAYFGQKQAEEETGRKRKK
jgi:metal-responsive CopG/Arc/MetJ family transcriptional regulator